MTQGLIILDKPAGITSARAVALVKRLLPRGTRVGHAGTLDPFATGLLLLLVGRATKQCERIMGWQKTYEASVKLGFTTVTDDPESREQLYATDLVPPSPAEVNKALAAFEGLIEQRPPLYSAIKVGGRRASDRVRSGATDLQLKARTVRIHSIHLHEYAWPIVRLQVVCGRGTYIRSIARDLGEALQVGGYLTQLRRTRIGSCRIEQAVTVDQLTRENIASHIIAVPAGDEA